MDINRIVVLLASLFAGISTALFFFWLFRQLRETAVQGGSADMDEAARRSIPILFRLLFPFMFYTRKMARGNLCAGMRQADGVRLAMAGYADTFSAADFVSLRLAAILAGTLLLFLCMLGKYTLYGLLLSTVISIYPGAWLTGRINKRHLSILKALPNMLDLLTLSVEAGKDFISSLRDILARRRLDSLGEEFLRTFQEIQLGKKRTDALRDMAQRVRQPDLTSTLNAVIQAEEMGVSIAHLLRIQGDALRNKRFTRAEKLANEAPVKIIFPIVIFILPTVFIILGVPIGMQVARFFK